GEASRGAQPAWRRRAGVRAGHAGAGHAGGEDGARVEAPPRPGRGRAAADPARRGMSITVERVTKSFGTFVALNEVSLEVPSGALLALLRPSGSGKTTLLRITAGRGVPADGAVR